MAKLATVLKWLVATAPGAIAGHLNVSEIQRIAFATLLSSGSLAAIVPALLASIGTVVAPQDVALATALITLYTEVRRRLNHGAQLPAHQL
jgi:hypothetical protein